ncbi:hypothetical protein Tco_1237994 [Tanacetum coccineum]
MIEAECLERMVVEIMRKEEDVLNIEKIKESDEKNTSTMAAGSTSRTKHSVSGSVETLVGTSLGRVLSFITKKSDHQSPILRLLNSLHPNRFSNMSMKLNLMHVHNVTFSSIKRRKVSMGGSYEKCSHVNGKVSTKEQDRGGQKIRRGRIKLAKIAVKQNRRRSNTGGTSANSKGPGSWDLHKVSHIPRGNAAVVDKGIFDIELFEGLRRYLYGIEIGRFANAYRSSKKANVTCLQMNWEIQMLRISTWSRNGFFKIMEGNKISPILKALEAKDCISSSSVSFSKCNLLGLSGWQLTNFVKRKLSDVYESESDSNDDSPNQDIIIIKAEYADDVFKIHLPVSLATLAVVKEEINKRCKLNPRTCNFKYLDEDE